MFPSGSDLLARRRITMRPSALTVCSIRLKRIWRRWPLFLVVNTRPKTEKKALERNQLIMKYLWDSSRGLFFDYDFMTPQAIFVRICHDILSPLGRVGFP